MHTNNRAMKKSIATIIIIIIIRSEWANKDYVARSPHSRRALILLDTLIPLLTYMISALSLSLSFTISRILSCIILIFGSCWCCCNTQAAILSLTFFHYYFSLSLADFSNFRRLVKQNNYCNIKVDFVIVVVPFVCCVASLISKSKDKAKVEILLLTIFVSMICWS